MGIRSSPVNLSNIDSSSRSQPHEPAPGTEFDWRPADDEGLQDLFTSNLDQEERQECRPNDADALELMHEPMVTRSSGPSNQPAQNTAPLVRRPQSAQEDLAAGFAFSKAKPLQPLDFSRMKKSIALRPSKSSVSSAGHIDEHNSRRDSQDTGQCLINPPPIAHATSLAVSPKQDVAPVKFLAIPFPNVATKRSQGSIDSESTPAEAHLDGQSLPAPTIPEEVSMSGDDTLLELVPHNMVPNSNQNQVSKGHDKSSSSDSGSDDPPQGCMTSNPDQQSTTTNSASPVIEKPNGAARVRSKDAKAERQDEEQSQARLVRSSPGNTPPPEEDLLRMLLYKHKENSREHERLQQALQAKETEYRDLYAASEDLYSQLQKMTQRCEGNQKQLNKIKEAELRWSNKVQQLSDYIKGLTNDHNRLRDDAEDIRKRQGSVAQDKTSMLETLREVQETTEARYSRSKHQIIEARRELLSLRQDFANQGMQLGQEKVALSAEKENNGRLQEQFSTLTSNQVELLENFKIDRDSITAKITNLLQKFDQAQASSLQTTQNDLRPLLEQCISMIKDISHCNDGVQPADLHQLNESLRSQLNDSLGLISSCDNGTSEIKDQQQKLASSLQEQLRGLKDSIATQQALNEQTTHLREIKATQDEKLQGKELALQEARSELSWLRQKDADQLAKISKLEDSRSHQSTEDLRMIQQIKDLSTLNQRIQKDLDEKNSETNALYGKIRDYDEERQQLNIRISESQTKLQEAQERVDAVCQEKTKCQDLAVQEQEEMRQFFSKAADRELEGLKSKHLNELHQLKSRMSETEKRFQEASTQLMTKETENVDLRNSIAQTKVAMESEKKQRQDQASLVSQLRHRINELELQSQGKDIQLGSLRSLLEDIRRSVVEKDTLIKRLRKAYAKKAMNSPSARGADAAQDPQSRPPGVVEDSQPNGYPKFASHEEILGEEGGSQLLTTETENLASLFPATPKGKSQELEISHTTYSSTKVRSREGTNETEHERFEQGHQRRSVSCSGSQVHTPSNGRGNLSPTARKSQTSVATPEWSKSPIPASRSQRPSQGSGAVPRGILKTTNQDGRGEKRKANGTEMTTAAGFTAPKKRKSDITRDLGPIIEDSQQSFTVISNRSRKQSAPRKPRREDKFSRAFAEHLP